MSRHTSGDLRVDPFSAERAVSVNYESVVFDSVQSGLARWECEANVAEAVRRWNAHEDLLAALVWAMNKIRTPTLVRGTNDDHFNDYHLALATLAKAGK